MIGSRAFALVPSYSRNVKGEGGIRNHLFWGRDDRSETWQGVLIHFEFQRGKLMIGKRNLRSK
jgi:hypothetical protein